MVDIPESLMEFDEGSQMSAMMARKCVFYRLVLLI